MKAIDISTHLKGLVEVLKPETVDRVIYGDPDAEVAGIAVAWMPYRETIERAAELGANVLVVHEPTFYGHWDLDEERPDIPPEVGEKKRLIDRWGITVIRCHDVWDAMPDIGIPFAWGDFLDLGKPIRGERFYNVYEVEPQAAMVFAVHVARKTAPLGQPAVGFYGDPERRVTTVGVGTGCISDPFKIFELEADLAVSVDDTVRAWVAGEWCRDTGNPLVVVNHNVAEEPGMVTLADHLATTFPDVKVTHIPQGCSYRSFKPEDG